MSPLVARGIALFNDREFFECHEVWEEEWTPVRGERRLFLQSLIHLAVGFYHHEQGNAVGRDRQLNKGLKKLAGYLPRYEGIATGPLYLAVVDWRETGGAYPMIRGLPRALPGPANAKR